MNEIKDALERTGRSAEVAPSNETVEADYDGFEAGQDDAALR